MKKFLTNLTIKVYDKKSEHNDNFCKGNLHVNVFLIDKQLLIIF
jgi:hypothetical protein